jgi:hypothetical protein
LISNNSFITGHELKESIFMMAERMSGNATNLIVPLLIFTTTATPRIRLIGSLLQLKILALMNSTRSKG